eukprot:CAMPEP_0168249340 /NCGR_PEP_ID=MMETSP0141_2-20121125/1950_1 /TAXON_ID=44445 /ORGANISM="Pseudo-nitzschia australis, Strain 10249 10 AB" /LENGTH=533 /DNA_ID=CAMNT_0008185329 /DNA_START=265 /DNA_END=1867 /DNA_ORIENTATION=-
MNNERWEPVKQGIDNNYGNCSSRESESRRDRKRHEKERLRSSSFCDSLDDISSDDDLEDPSILTGGNLRRRLRRLARRLPSPVMGLELSLAVTREVQIPDQIRVSRSLRLPELGPKILFFSGGTAIKDLSACLTNYTHNSIHLITPFDSGGSSAEIRRGFNMLSVGDIRNRLLALSERNESTMRNNAQVIEFFAHRLVKMEGPEAAESEYQAILDGRHLLIRAVELPMRSILQNHLRWFSDRMPKDFDLRGASIGNLIITGCFLEHNRDIVTAIFIVAKFLGVKGFCRPLTAANLHIRTLYADGRELVGQHLMSLASRSPSLMKNLDHKYPSDSHNSNKIVRIDLVKELNPASDANRQESQSCHIDILSSDFVSSVADLICFPMGSFFASIIVNLLPTGVGRAIAERRCPKVYIPNTGFDPEMTGRTIAECVSLIIDMVRTNPCHNDNERGETECVVVPVENILNFVLLDTANCEYAVPVDKAAIEKLGVTVIDVPLVEDHERGVENDASKHLGKSKILNAEKVSEVLISLAS